MWLITPVETTLFHIGGVEKTRSGKLLKPELARGMCDFLYKPKNKDEFWNFKYAINCEHAFMHVQHVVYQIYFFFID